MIYLIPERAEAGVWFWAVEYDGLWLHGCNGRLRAFANARRALTALQSGMAGRCDPPSWVESKERPMILGD